MAAGGPPDVDGDGRGADGEASREAAGRADDRADGDDHEGRSCNNRLTLVDYEKLLDYLTERTYAGDGLQETNLTGLKFTLKGVDYEVLEHTKDKYRVLMLNRKAISK